MSGRKARIKTWIKGGLLRSGMLRVASHVTPASAVILMYHSVVDDPELTRHTIRVSQARCVFEQQMRTLAERFTPVSLQDIVAFARDGQRLPRRAVAVTFDDGFADNYREVLPVLARNGIPATFYIMVNAIDSGILPWYCRLNFAFQTSRHTCWTDTDTGNVFPLNSSKDRVSALSFAWGVGARKTGKVQTEFLRDVETSLEVQPPQARVMLTWDEVRALKEAGHIIGAHSLSHPNLAHVSEPESRVEIEGCKRRLEEALGGPVHHFSYPHPALDPCWSPRTVELMREAGFHSAVLTDCGPVRHGDNPLLLKRIYSANRLDQWIWNLECTLLGRRI
jgi:peptidoglycan/xylan/chitin deacetylase (PgdA/CDA1 family)